MAGKISDMTPVSPAQTTDLVEISRPGTPDLTRSVTLADIVALAGSGGAQFDAVAQAIFDHYYDCNDASGLVLTDSGVVGGANGAIAASGIKYRTVALRGDGKGCPFLYTTGYLTVPDNTGASACTFMSQFAIDPGTSGLPVLWSSTTDASVHGFQLWMPNGTQLEFQWGDGSSAATINTNAAWGDIAIFGEIITVIFTHDGSVATLWVNGLVVASTAHSYVKSGNANIMVGAYQSGPADQMSGVAGKIGVNATAITDAQIYSLINAQRCS